MQTQISKIPDLKEIVAEYDWKVKNAKDAVLAFEQAGADLQTAATVFGTFGHTRIDTGSVYERTILESLKKSAWRYVYARLDIDRIATAKDKNLFEQSFENPPEFTAENVWATFGDYASNPFENILRGLAEVFADLDPAYKSHEKMKIGVSGLPKRIIMSGCGEYSQWGKKRIENVLNALAAYQNKPLVEYAEMNELFKNGDCMLAPWTYTNHKGEEIIYPARGVRLKRFDNGNGHLFFEPDTLKDINKALAQYYGEVLPDCQESEHEKRQSTTVAKDLQYYPTPKAVIEKIMYEFYIPKGSYVLEPSCGCGRILDALTAKGCKSFGVEVDAGRAREARDKGHSVICANFLELQPNPVYDFVVMNPPFYGTHYAKHIEHAKKFLKDKGTLISVLPATARYDHGLLKDGRWIDLPVGSFRESGTNINTTIYMTGK